MEPIKEGIDPCSRHACSLATWLPRQVLQNMHLPILSLLRSSITSHIFKCPHQGNELHKCALRVLAAAGYGRSLVAFKDNAGNPHASSTHPTTGLARYELSVWHYYMRPGDNGCRARSTSTTQSIEPVESIFRRTPYKQ